MLASWAESHAEQVKGMVVMGSFLERKRFEILADGSHKLNWSIPTLTLGAELDGLARVFRMAEASYK